MRFVFIWWVTLISTNCFSCICLWCAMLQLCYKIRGIFGTQKHVYPRHIMCVHVLIHWLSFVVVSHLFVRLFGFCLHFKSHYKFTRLNCCLFAVRNFLWFVILQYKCCSLLKTIWWTIVANYYIDVILVSAGELSNWQS